jgi:flavodoxin I
MKVLIGYFSETGNTKKIADAMGEEAKSSGHDVQIETVGKIVANQLGEYDIVLLGSTCHSSDVAAPVKNLLDGIPEGAPFKLAGFVTHATTMPEGDDWKKDMYKKWAGRCQVTFETISAEKKIEFLGYFHCEGAPSPPIEAFIRSTIITDDDQWAEYREEVKKHPTAEDLAAAKAFVKDLLT